MSKKGQGGFGLMAAASIFFTVVVLVILVYVLIFRGGVGQKLGSGGSEIDLGKYTLISILDYEVEENLNLIDLISLSVKDNSYEERIKEALENLFDESDAFYILSLKWEGGSYLFVRDNWNSAGGGEVSRVVVPGFDNEQVIVELTISKGGLV